MKGGYPSQIFLNIDGPSLLQKREKWLGDAKPFNLNKKKEPKLPLLFKLNLSLIKLLLVYDDEP